MTVATPTEIAAALSENSSAPFGRPRNVRSEELAELATQTGDRPLIIRALQELIRAHEYGGERDRMLVPFARVLRMWDENPADFDASTSYRLHWQFKWVSSGMVDHPGVSLTIIRQWLDEMESRYRRAGYGLRAVHSGRHVLAAHLGDTEAAERAYDDWVTADRDMMTDCHACERNGQGDWKATTGRGAEALDIWQPVLDGSLRCDEEPHRVLAQSLLPLARLGLLEEARANHLRGYRMARRNPNLRIAIGKHIEFAALTGNEARGLEILAEHADWLEPSGENANARRAFLEGVAILLQRLHLLGYAETSVPAPRATSEVMAVGDLLEKVTGEIADIVQLFDERNANTTVSRRSQARLSHPAVVEVLPLGIRSAPIATPGRAVPQPPPVEPARAIGIADLIDEAVRLSDSHHPRAAAAWERVASAGVELRPDIEARVAESRALAHGRRHPTQAHTAFLDVTARFAALGDDARATVNRARAALAAMLQDDGQPPAAGTPDADLAAAMDEITALHAAGRADNRQLIAVRLSAANASVLRWLTTDGSRNPNSPAYAAVRSELIDVISVADGANEPFQAASATLRLAQAALAAGHHELLDTETAGILAHLLAEACWRVGGRDREVVDLALTAANHLDATAPPNAARARLLAAHAFFRSNRPAEAVALLEAMLPDIEAHCTEVDVVEARRMYGRCLMDLHEYREAAQVLLGAASIAQGWPDQAAHASIAHDAAYALEAAGLVDQAEQAYRRAADRWRDVGNLDAQIRATRAQAWLRLRYAQPDETGALALMEAAANLATTAAGTSDTTTPEHYETLRQTAHLLLDWSAEGRTNELTSRGLAAAEAAARGFEQIGDHAKATQAQFTAARLESEHLDRRQAASERIRQVRQRCEKLGEASLVSQCDNYLRWLAGQPPR